MQQVGNLRSCWGTGDGKRGETRDERDHVPRSSVVSNS